MSGRTWWWIKVPPRALALPLMSPSQPSPYPLPLRLRRGERRCTSMAPPPSTSCAARPARSRSSTCCCPKGASRMVQRIGRANHRLDEPSRALFVPANRFEMLECQAAREAIAENNLDGDPPRVGALDVLAQHVMGCAVSEPFDLLELYDEVCSAGPYRDLPWEDFEQVVDFVSTGGYALKTYDRFRRIVRLPDGRW